MTAPTLAKKPRRLTSAFQRLMSVHWWMAGCYLILFCTGTFMARLPRELWFRSSFYDFHKSIGVLVMGLLTWRILVLLQAWWKKYTKRFPKLTKDWFHQVSLHVLLYIFMWVVPVSGFLLSNSVRANNVKFFGFVLPELFPQNQAMVEVGRSLHFWMAYTFLAFILLHMLAQWQVVKANWRRWQTFWKTRSGRKHKADQSSQ